MNTKAILPALLFFAMFFLINACENSTNTDNQTGNDYLYYNTFEKAADTSGWQGEGLDKLAGEHSPEGGKSSLHIAGGCPQPAASFEISQVQGGNYKISLWAKMGQPEQSATVYLGSNTTYEASSSLEVTVRGEDWKYYESENYLHVPHKDILRVEFYVGGIVFADVFIDNLRIEKVK